MDDILSALLGLGCFLAVVMLLIHVVWTVAAKVYAAVTGRVLERPSPVALAFSTAPMECPRCATRMPDRKAGCLICGWPQTLPKSVSSQRAVNWLERQLQRYHLAGIFDTATYVRLTEAIRSELPQTQEVSRAAKPVATPVAAALPQVERAAPPPPSYPLQADLVTAEIVAESSTASQAPSAPIELWSTDAATPGERVREFIRRQAEPTQAAPSPPEQVSPTRLAQLFSAFLEERHIRWGELVGGMLIVCCSIALVISFWSRIAEMPVLKFLVFNGVTAAMFGLGFYSHQRWKLPTTSHGLLVIATLLVPLNFLAIAAFTRQAADITALTMVGEALSVALFSFLVYRGGGSIVHAPLALVVGVLGPSIGQLLVRRFVHADMSTMGLAALAVVPTACFLISTGWALLQIQRRELTQSSANALFTLLGIVSLATLLPLALLLVRSEQAALALHRLAPLAALWGAPYLACGLFFWQRAATRELVQARTAGTAIAVFGSLLMLSGIGLAWPATGGMLLAAVACAILFTCISMQYRISAALVPGLACATLVWLLVAGLLRGEITWQLDEAATMARTLLSAASGLSLAPLVALLGLAAWQLRRSGRMLDARFVGWVTLSIATVSLVVVSWHGLGRTTTSGQLTWLFAGYSAAALMAAFFGNGRRLAVAGSAIGLLALVQGLAFDFAATLDLTHPWATALLLHATAMGFLAALTSVGRDAQTRGSVRDAWAGASVVTSVLAAGTLAWLIPQANLLWLALHCLWLASVWLVVAWHYASPLLMAGVQAATALCVTFGVASQLQLRPWFNQSRLPWIDPWSVQAVGSALALLILVWSLARIALLRPARRAVANNGEEGSRLACQHRVQMLLGAPAAQLDRWLLAALLLAATWLAVYGALPGVARELTPRRLAVQLAADANTSASPTGRIVPPLEAFQWQGIPHQHALQWGSWLLIGTLASVLLVRQWERFNPWRVLALVLLASLACPLIAGMFEAEVASASALRWLTALFLAAASVAIWLREPLAAAAGRLGWHASEHAMHQLRRDALLLAVVLVALPLTLMGGYTALAAVWNAAIDPSVRSTWNGLLVLFAVVGGVALLFGGIGRQVTTPLTERDLGWQTWLPQVSLMLLILATGPLVVVSLYVVSTALRGNPIVGPEPGTFFARIGLAVSYASPIVLIALTLIGHAFRERSSAFAFTAGLLLNVSATAAWLLVPHAGGLQFDWLLWVKLAQLNTIVTAAYAILWLAATSRQLRRSTIAPIRYDPLLGTQVALAAVLAALVLVPASLALWWQPLPTPAQEQLGQPLGWCAVLTSLAALTWLRWRTDRRISAVTISLATLAIGTTFSFWLARWDVGNWLCWHGMLITLVISAWLLPLIIWLRRTNTSSFALTDHAAISWLVTLATVTVVWGMRSGWSDPQRPWWSLGSIGAIALLSSCLACWRGQRRYLLAASLLVNLAVTIVWLNLASLPNHFGGMLVELAALQAISLALPTLAWLALDLRVMRSRFAKERTRGGIAIHTLTATAAMLIVTGLVALGLWADLNGEFVDARPWLNWLSLASSLLAVAACLWDQRVTMAHAGLYVLGLAAVGMTLDQFNLSREWLIWTGTMLVAAYTLATSYLWSRRNGLLAWCDWVGMPRRDSTPFAELGWLLTANGILIATVMALATWVDLTFMEQSLRLLTGKAAIVQALSVGLLSRGQRRSRLQWSALVVAVLGAILWGWAWLEPDMHAAALHRLVVVAVTLAAMSALYGVGLVKLLRSENEWTRAAGQLVPALVSLAGLSLALVLAWEVVLQATTGAVPMAWPAIVAVAAALATVSAAALAAAVLPGRDPLGLSEQGRTAYVYAAEGVLALLFLHVRLTMPLLFSGFFLRYWPYLAMLVAFVGVALSEWFRRRQQRVLAEPLENTAALLPVLPLLGFWATPVEGHYSMLLIAVGAMYAALSTLKRSFGFGLLSALALHGAMWYLLHQTDGLGLAEHPQLWLIPPALCVLAAAYLNRDRLSDNQMSNLRYLSSTVIYVSSTADMFLTGVAEAPWLPLVLAALAVGGVFLGIMLRVRGFLLLGASFLALAMATMIWHAAWNLQHTWVWSVSGIVAGMLIIALFAVFEKKRPEVLRLVEQFKEWEA